MDKILFAQAFSTTPYLSSCGLSGMVYLHLSGCFIPKNPSLKFLNLFQATIVVACGDIPRLVVLVLGVNKLLAMAKDIGGLHPIVVSEVFL